MAPLTRRVLLKVAGTGGIATLAGCQGQTNDDGATEASTTARTTTEPTFSVPRLEQCIKGLRSGGESQPESPVGPPQKATERYYDGPLFLTHEHFYVNPPLEDWGGEMTAECLPWYLEFMRRNDIEAALPFIAAHQLPIFEDHLDRFAPFVGNAFCGASKAAVPPERWPEIVEQRLASSTEWDGLGEFGLHLHDRSSGESQMQPPTKDPVRANHPAMAEIYEMGAQRDLPVMLHPLRPDQLGEAGRSDPLSNPLVQALEEALETHRETRMLVHGLAPVGEWIGTLLERHPNLYYDVAGTMNPHNWLQEGGPPNDYSDHMTPDHVVEHAKKAVETLRPIVERAPDRITVGLHTGIAGGIEASLKRQLMDRRVLYYRLVLGRFSTERATAVGHRNAEQLVDLGANTE